MPEGRVNRSPISLREGKVFLDGKEVMDGVKCSIVFQPDVWEGNQVGNRAVSRRYLGGKYTGSITERRSTPWLMNAIKKYREDGKTPEFTIQGIMDDKGSDYFTNHGSYTVTATGCVLTGDITLFDLDTGGSVMEDTIAFGANSVVW